MKSAILDAAEKVFSREGETGLSIRRLAEEIDYSPSAIYKYFSSKDELLDELKEAFFERLMLTIDKAALAELPFEDRVRACFMQYIETAIERPHHYAAAFSSGPDFGAAEGEFYWDEFEGSLKGQAFMVVVSLVEEGQAVGAFDAKLSPHLAAKSLWASMHGLALLLINMPGFPALLPQTGPPFQTADFIRLHTDLMIRSLSAFNSETIPARQNT